LYLFPFVYMTRQIAEEFLGRAGDAETDGKGPDAQRFYLERAAAAIDGHPEYEDLSHEIERGRQQTASLMMSSQTNS
jgi:hypothetical protein